MILALLAVPALAGIGGTEVSAPATALFVPAFHGAVTFDAALEGRFPEALDEYSGLPDKALRLHAGYLHYLDGHGHAAVGGYLGGGLGLGDDPAYSGAELGVAFRLRGISDAFYHATASLYGEVGLLTSKARGIDCPGCDTLAPRYAYGLEIGGGLLWYLDPYIFGEYVARLGLETVRFEGSHLTTVYAAMRVNFDFAIRGREVEF